MQTPHAQAVLFLCNQLTAAGHTVISANTDEQGCPQIFAQSETGELAFYFLRAKDGEPPSEDLERFRALAKKHGVTAFFAAIASDPELRCLGIQAL